MSLLVFAIFVLIVVAMLVWAVAQIDMIPPPIKQLITALIIVLGAVAIAQKVGIF